MARKPSTAKKADSAAAKQKNAAPKVGSPRGNAGKGRRKGSQNKTTAALKDAILNAFNQAGGERYLLTLAQTDPKTFAMLLGRVLPLTVAGDKDNPVQLNVGVSWMTEAQAKARGWA